MNNDQYAPQPGDDTLTRGKVFLESTNMFIMESYPVQVNVNLTGSLPTPCNKLRAVINTPDANKNIKIELYSVIDPDVMCAQTLQPFEATLSLGSFPAGHYTVLVNDEKLGEFDS
jgi:inhibitor of cysteine peptidase